MNTMTMLSASEQFANEREYTGSFQDEAEIIPGEEVIAALDFLSGALWRLYCEYARQSSFFRIKRPKLSREAVTKSGILEQLYYQQYSPDNFRLRKDVIDHYQNRAREL